MKLNQLFYTLCITTGIILCACNSGNGSGSSPATGSPAPTPTPSPTTGAAPIILGYYSNSDVYKAGIPNASVKYSFKSYQTQAKLSRLNSVIYAFFEVTATGSLYSVDFWSDFNDSDKDFCAANSTICGSNTISGGYGNFSSFANPNQGGLTNRLIAVGGATHDADIEKALAHPQAFANSLKTLVTNYPAINGVDIDYEPIAGIAPENITPFINLLKAIRTTMGNKFLIAYTILPNPATINSFNKSNWQDVAQYVNYINVMGYDMFGNWGGITTTGLQSALYSTGDKGINSSNRYHDDATIQALQDNGIPSKQIILGVPAYGRSVTKVAADGIGQPFAEVANSAYRGDLDDQTCTTGCSGTISYEAIVKNNYTMQDVIINDIILGTYSNFTGSGNFGKVFVTYDSPAAVATKVNYAKSKQLAGVMIWDLNYDVSATNNNGTPNANSLLNAINAAYTTQPRPVAKQSTPYITITIHNQLNGSSSNPYTSISLVKGTSTLLAATATTAIAVNGSQAWGSSAIIDNPQAPNGTIANNELDKLFNASNSFTTEHVYINKYLTANPASIWIPAEQQIECTPGKNYTFEAGKDYSVIIDQFTPNGPISCTIGTGPVG